MNNDIWKQARGLTQKLKKQQADNESIGEKLIGWAIGSVIGLLLIVFVVLPLIVYFIWSHAYVLVKLWSWFVVPIFHVNPLTWAQAWGLMMIVTFLTHVSNTWKAEDERPTSAKVTDFVVVMLKPWVVLFAGWICAHFFLHLF